MCWLMTLKRLRFTSFCQASKYFKVQLLANYHSQNTGAEMLVSDILIVMTKRKKEIWHEHVEDNPQILKRGGGGVMFVTIIHFIILNNLFERECYWYCFVHMIKFITERANCGKKNNNWRLSMFH